MFWAEEKQITNNNNQNQSRNNKVNIRIHSLFLPQIEIIKSKQKQTADNGGKKIGVDNIPFDHNFTSLANPSEITKKTAAITSDIPSVKNKLKMVWGRKSTGEITPRENHATAMFPNTSEALSNCPMNSFLIGANFNMNE